MKLLKPRILPAKKGDQPRFHIFLLSDHKGFLPPKKMLQFGDTISETHNGKEYNVTLRWHQSCDPFDYLKDYGIIQYLRPA